MDDVNTGGRRSLEMYLEELDRFTPLPEEMDDAAIRSRIYPARDRSDSTKAEIAHEWVDREMRRPGVTMTLLWNEYVDDTVSRES